MDRALDIVYRNNKRYCSGGGCSTLNSHVADLLDQLTGNPSKASIKAYLLSNPPEFGCDHVYKSMVEGLFLLKE